MSAAPAWSKYTILFTCENEKCGGIKGRAFNEEATPKKMTIWMGFNENDQRYILAKKSDGSRTTHLSIYMIVPTPSAASKKTKSTSPSP